MQVFVRDNDVDQALRVLKKKMQREGIARRQLARKIATGDGLTTPAPPPSKGVDGGAPKP